MTLEKLIAEKAETLNGCASAEDRINTAVLFVAKDLHRALGVLSDGIHGVTQEMLEAAMKEAVKNGLLQPYADAELYLKRWDLMKSCIQAALDKAANRGMP